MRPRQFIGYAERKLDRPLSDGEYYAIQCAREESHGKREGVKAMRAALEDMLDRRL